MLISPEVFSAIVAAIKSQPKSTDLSERRKSAREPVVGEAVIIPCSGKKKPSASIVEVRDISPEGLGIVHSQALKVGEEFILYLASMTEPKAILCTVIRWNPLGQRDFAIGATFTRTLRIVAATADSVDRHVVQQIEERLAAAQT